MAQLCDADHPPADLGTADCVWDLGAALGEGPAWIGGALWFVDIKGAAIHRFESNTLEKQSFPFEGQPSFIVPTADGAFCVGSKDGLFRFTPEGEARLIAKIPIGPADRTNDATVDDKGRVWFGTMDDREAAPSGAVFVAEGDIEDALRGAVHLIEDDMPRAAIRRVGGECVIPNGPAISPCGRFLYHVDTLGRTIWRFDISEGEALTDGVRFVEIAEGDGNPDGVTVDAEGCLWVALWGGWSVRRYDPDGVWIASVAIPCAQVTKVAFGGPDLRTGFVTTARIGLSEGDALLAQPLAGGLFRFAAPAAGRPVPAFGRARN